MTWEFTTPIRTPRLELRPLVPDDAPAVHRWMSDPEVTRYQLYDPRTLDQVIERVAEYSTSLRLAENGDYVQPAIVVDGDVIGALYVTLTSTADRTLELGWALRADQHGRGYATEAVTAILALAFDELGVHRVVAEIDPRNTASARLCQRLGMRHEAHYVENLWFDEAWADTDIYGLLDREWISRRASP